MEWVQIFIIIVVNCVFMIILKADLTRFERNIENWKTEVDRERKDFHGKLCGLNEKYKR